MDSILRLVGTGGTNLEDLTKGTKLLHSTQTETNLSPAGRRLEEDLQWSLTRVLLATCKHVSRTGWGCSDALEPLGGSHVFPKLACLRESPAGIPRTDPEPWRGKRERRPGALPTSSGRERREEEGSLSVGTPPEG